MNNITCKRCIILLTISIMLFFFYPSDALHGEQTSTSKESDHYASDFKLKDINGLDVKLSDYRGKPILLYFMTTWCPQCRSMIPEMKKIHSLYQAKGLIILSVDVMESKKKADAYSKKYSLPYPILLDDDGNVSRTYGVVGVPVKALIDREGRIICWNCRKLDIYIEQQIGINDK